MTASTIAAREVKKTDLSALSLSLNTFEWQNAAQQTAAV
jgi:hypothetical protein